MNKHGWVLRNVAFLMAVLMFLMLPVTGCYASTENESMGQTCAIGLFVIIVGVLAWLGLRSDLDSDRYSAPLKQEPYRYPGEYAMQDVSADESADMMEQAAVRVNADGLLLAF